MSDTSQNKVQKQKPSITLYSKPACPACFATERALKKQAIVFNTVDISLDAEAYAHVIKMGHRSAPVVVFGDQSWSGFRPDMIAKMMSFQTPILQTVGV